MMIFTFKLSLWNLLISISFNTSWLNKLFIRIWLILVIFLKNSLPSISFFNNIIVIILQLIITVLPLFSLLFLELFSLPPFFLFLFLIDFLIISDKIIILTVLFFIIVFIIFHVINLFRF